MYKVVFKFLNINDNKTIFIDKIDFKTQRFYADGKVYDLKNIADGQILRKDKEIEVLLAENIGVNKRVVLSGEFHTTIGVYNIVSVNKGIAILSNGKGADLSKVIDVESNKFGSKLNLVLRNSREMLVVSLTSLIDKNATDKIMVIDLIGKALYTKSNEYKFHYVKSFKPYRQDYKTKIDITTSMTIKSKFLLSADLILKDNTEVKINRIECNRLISKLGPYEVKLNDEIKIIEYKGDRYEIKVYER